MECQKTKTAWQKYSAGDRVLIEKYFTEEAARKLLEEILRVKICQV